MKINGTPIPHNFPTKKLSGAGGKSGCLPGLLVLAVLGTGWLSMVLTGSGWTS